MDAKAAARMQRKLDAVHKLLNAMSHRLERIEKEMLMDATEFADRNKRARPIDSEAEEVSGTESEIERREHRERRDESSEDDLVVIPERIESNGKELIVVFTTEDGDTRKMEACAFQSKHRETMNDFSKLPGMSVLREYLNGPDEFDFSATIPIAEMVGGRMCKYHGFAHERDRFNPNSESCRLFLGRRRS